MLNLCQARPSAQPIEQERLNTATAQNDQKQYIDKTELLSVLMRISNQTSSPFSTISNNKKSGALDIELAQLPSLNATSGKLKSILESIAKHVNKTELKESEYNIIKLSGQ